MKEISVSHVHAGLEQVREWFLSHQLEHFSVLAGMNPEEHLTLEKKVRLLEDSSEETIRLALGAERATYDEVDGQMDPVHMQVPTAVVFELRETEDKRVEIRGLAMQASGAEKKLESWLARQTQCIEEALNPVEEVNQGDPGSADSSP